MIKRTVNEAVYRGILEANLFYLVQFLKKLTTQSIHLK